jgi:ATP-dependent Clp protease ATP-binding subunit ClpA
VYAQENTAVKDGLTYCELTHKADFYSLGMTILSLWMGEGAFMAKEHEMALDKVKGRITIPADIPDPLARICRGLLIRDPEKRWNLDEIEKADSSVLTTLLQMLDEGILRDIKGREVSFRDAIVIATSNAGANRIREFVDSGYDLGSHKEQFTEELISSGIFKPEFLNRFDEICLFKPLGREELSQIAELILAGVNKTLAPQKITVTLTDEAKQILIDNGYDPKMGARPMRRIVQKTVENLVAKAVLSGSAEAGAQITLDAEQIKSQLD